MPYGRCDESWFCFLIIYQVYKLINNLVTTFVCSVQAEGGRGLLSGGGGYVRGGLCPFPTMTLTSGANVSTPAFEPEEDILNIHCSTNEAIYNVLYIVSLRTDVEYTVQQNRRSE